MAKKATKTKVVKPVRVIATKPGFDGAQRRVGEEFDYVPPVEKEPPAAEKRTPEAKDLPSWVVPATAEARAELASPIPETHPTLSEDGTRVVPDFNPDIVAAPPETARRSRKAKAKAKKKSRSRRSASARTASARTAATEESA